MNSDENDSNQITDEDPSNKDKTDTTVQERSEYDFDDSNPEDSNGFTEKTTNESEHTVAETGVKRGRGRPPKNPPPPPRAREPEGSPPRKSARIANK